jgi:5-formyltetrahydrofolate cyclo-ligase
MNINEPKLVELFFKLRKELINSGKFKILSNKVVDNIINSYFFNRSQTICLYNHYNSVILTKLLNNQDYYFKNIFAFPRLNSDDNLDLYHISCRNDLIIDNLGIVDIIPECFKININEIDIILVSGMAFDHKLNVLNIDDNNKLYNLLLSRSNALKIGICLENQVYQSGLPNSKHTMDCLITENGLHVPVSL